jgi:hypothetical protein
MSSISLSKLCEIAAAVAFELGLQWRLEDLQMRALEAYRTAMRRTASSGLSREQASKLVREHIYKHVLKAGKGMDALPPGKSKPTPEQIETALEAFTVRQWTPVERFPPIELSPPMKDWPIIEYRYGLMESASLVEVEALLSYIRQNAGDLKQRIGARKVEAIEGRAIERSTKLCLAEDRSEVCPISDPFWAAFWREQARQANREGRALPASGRSVIEQASDRSIAERLSKVDEQTGREMTVSPYEVKMWRERAAKISYERFAAEAGANDEEERAAAFITWLSMIRTKHQRTN